MVVVNMEGGVPAPQLHEQPRRSLQHRNAGNGWHSHRMGHRLFRDTASWRHRHMGLQDGSAKMAGHVGHGLLSMDTPGCRFRGFSPRYVHEYTAAIGV